METNNTNTIELEKIIVGPHRPTPGPVGPDLSQKETLLDLYEKFNELVEEKAQKRVNELQASTRLKSEKTNEINAALSIAQGEFEDVSKASKGYSGVYAGYPDLVRSVRPALAKNKLSVTQQIKYINGVLMFITTLGHASGQWIESEIPILQKFIPDNDKNPQIQQFGALLTYMERYNFRLILNIACDKE